MVDLDKFEQQLRQAQEDASDERTSQFTVNSIIQTALITIAQIRTLRADAALGARLQKLPLGTAIRRNRTGRWSVYEDLRFRSFVTGYKATWDDLDSLFDSVDRHCRDSRHQTDDPIEVELEESQP